MSTLVMAGDTVCSVALGVIADLHVVSQDSKIGIGPCAELLHLYRDCFDLNKPIHRFGNDVVAIVGLLTV